jgi:hypothetical protein
MHKRCIGPVRFPGGGKVIIDLYDDELLLTSLKIQKMKINRSGVLDRYILVRLKRSNAELKTSWVDAELS